MRESAGQRPFPRNRKGPPSFPRQSSGFWSISSAAGISPGQRGADAPFGHFGLGATHPEVCEEDPLGRHASLPAVMSLWQSNVSVGISTISNHLSNQLLADARFSALVASSCEAISAFGLPASTRSRILRGTPRRDDLPSISARDSSCRPRRQSRPAVTESGRCDSRPRLRESCRGWCRTG
jgi:hypothetical protein